MNTIEFVVTYKPIPHEQQTEAVFNFETAANNFAFDIESNGGVAIVTRRIKHVPHGQEYTDSGDTDQRTRF